MEENKGIWQITQNIILQDFQIEETWKNQSCPKIYPNINSMYGFCEDSDTYETAEVAFNCHDLHKSPNIQGH